VTCRYVLRALVYDADPLIAEFIGCCGARGYEDARLSAVRATGADGVFGLAKANKCGWSSTSVSLAGKSGIQKHRTVEKLGDA
jgi:hypothetical protein